MQAEIRDGYWAVFDIDGLKTEPGPRLVELIDNRLTEFAERYAATYPAGLRLLQDLRRSLLEPPRQLRPRPTPTRRTSDRPEPASALTEPSRSCQLPGANTSVEQGRAEP